MKLLISVLLMLAVSCTSEAVYETQYVNVSFVSAYGTVACMGSSPATVKLEFTDVTIILPVIEVRSGVVSTKSAQISKSKHELLNVTVFNEEGDIVSYSLNKYGLHDLTIIITGSVFNPVDDFDVYGQLFCDKNFKQ